jgi:hypothetical protein
MSLEIHAGEFMRIETPNGVADVTFVVLQVLLLIFHTTPLPPCCVRLPENVDFISFLQCTI